MFPPPALASSYHYWRLLGEGGFEQVYKASRIADGKVSQSQSDRPSQGASYTSNTT
jgi:serine/threonine protein kinase